MSEYHFADAVFFEQLRKPRFRRTQRKRRIMNQGDKLVALFQKRLTAIQRQTETFAFAAVKFFVLGGKIRAAGTAPPAGTRIYFVADTHRVGLQKIKSFVRRAIAKFRDAAPPEIVIAFDKHLFAGQIFQTGKIFQRVLLFHRPRNIAGNQHDVIRRDFAFPVGADFIEMPRPRAAEHIHRFRVVERQMKIADCINTHSNIIAVAAKKGNFLTEIFCCFYKKFTASRQAGSGCFIARRARFHPFLHGQGFILG